MTIVPARVREICVCGNILSDCEGPGPKTVVLNEECKCGSEAGKQKEEFRKFRCPECGDEWVYGTADERWVYKPVGAKANLGKLFSGKEIEGIDPAQEYAWHLHLDEESQKVKGTLVRANRVELTLGEI
jgi:predicted RNA-binding Zn-ribbon protein involved in translation (DUF1610 family)